MSGQKPVDPNLVAALRPLVEEVKREIKADLGKALEHGARAWAAQSNQVFESVSARLARLEQHASQAAVRPPNKQR
jgi:hypothetical protein